ncbi:MAG: pyridoxamine 5'-phosphate oxidase [Gammaproteobacteria bacterium]|nr:pyridoxamine 5'-phosphate oxidase [Gammaproteobacteria bacterium]NNC68071.1 pyridoxamine 5'-phosphate oxidase [Gammaproteobacteria bacterium]
MSQDINIKDLRQNYETRTLEEDNVNKDPFKQFQLWMDEALAADFVEPNAMNVATVNKDGDISSRMVLLKGFDEKGFVFFTNYQSNKANDLASINKAALNVWWDKLHRQVRVNGAVEKVSREETVKYFHSRPRGSQIGAVASQQSRVIKNHVMLEEEYKKIESQFEGQEIPCPEHWGGYRVIPEQFEFWQGRPNRLHDRLRYAKTDSDEWKIERLSP